MSHDQPAIAVENLTLAFGDHVVQHDVSFTVGRGEIFVIMGGSGCGKSTLLRSMVGLLRPAAGEIFYDRQPFWRADEERRASIQRGLGILFQSGALWSSMTLAENIALPLAQYTALDAADIDAIASLKLALVGLDGFGAFFPAEISGGMKKRAGLARAIALDPTILFFVEPSAGLDPISSRRLDDLILELRDALRATIVMVTHELPSIFAVADNSVFLDAATHTAIARGNPRDLRDHSSDATVRDFLTRGGSGGSAAL